MICLKLAFFWFMDIDSFFRYYYKFQLSFSRLVVLVRNNLILLDSWTSSRSRQLSVKIRASFITSSSSRVNCLHSYNCLPHRLKCFSSLIMLQRNIIKELPSVVILWCEARLSDNLYSDLRYRKMAFIILVCIHNSSLELKTT